MPPQLVYDGRSVGPSAATTGTPRIRARARN